jgi:hypothetical protein
MNQKFGISSFSIFSERFLLKIQMIFFTVINFFYAIGSIAFAQDLQVAAKPQWASSLKPPIRAGEKCFMGSSASFKDSNQALAEAYKNALLNVIEREFPDLISISTLSSEKLEGSTYSRNTAYKSEYVQFSGLTEDKESPFVDSDQSKQSYSALRLLCWPIDALGKERKRQDALKRNDSSVITSKVDGLLPPNARPGPTGELEVKTIPAGATILLSSVPVGNSNARFEKVIAGSYEVVVQKDGYEIESRKVVVSAGKKVVANFILQKVKSTITIKSEPQGAFVYVNNKPQDKRTPIQLEYTAGEEVDVRLEKDDFYTERRVLIVSDRPREELFRLRTQDAVISVLSTPSGADVFFDGKKIGKTPIVGRKVEGGKHRIILKSSGFEDSVTEIEAYRSQPVALLPRLKPIADSKTSLSAKQIANQNDDTECIPEPGQMCDRTHITVRKLIAERCASNDAEACTKLGWFLAQGLGGKRDEFSAKKLFILGCDGNVARSCLYLGRMLESGTGGAVDAERAKEIFQKARAFFSKLCDSGDADGCLELGNMWSLGIGGAIDLKESKALYKKACNRGKQVACGLVNRDQ